MVPVAVEGCTRASCHAGEADCAKRLNVTANRADATITASKRQ
jgi:hypothetical protein